MHILPITQKINSFSASKYDKKAEGYRGYTAVNPKNSIAKSIRALDKKIITNINNIYLGCRENKELMETMIHRYSFIVSVEKEILYSKYSKKLQRALPAKFL